MFFLIPHKDDEGMWYYLKPSGAMANGWTQVDGKWYFLRADGVMMYNTIVNGYKIGNNGEWIK